MFGDPEKNAHVSEEFQVEFRMKGDDPRWPMSRLCENMKSLKHIDAWLKSCTKVTELRITKIQTIRTDVTGELRFKPGDKT